MKKFAFLFTVVSFFFICGCGNDYESRGEAVAEKLTAAHMLDYVVYNKVAGQNYMPGLTQMHAEDFINFCTKNSVPMDKPVLELLKQGFPDVQTTVKHKVITESDNPFIKSDVIYAVEYRIDATNNPHASYLAVLIFAVAETPEGTAVMEIGGYDELNGRRTTFSTPEQVILRIGGISRGVDDMLKFFAEQNKAKGNE